MTLRRVLPDTNVCYPISLLDLLLRLDEAALHVIIWTDDLLEELARTWVEKGARSPAAAERVCEAIRDAFPEGRVATNEYEHLVGVMPGGDPDDHLHAAAAAARAPALVLTRNRRDFPVAALAAYGVTVRDPDEYLVELFREHPEEVAQVVVEMAADRSRPPMTAGEVLEALRRAGVPAFAAHVMAHLAD